jgi:hypothetical protein
VTAAPVFVCWVLRAIVRALIARVVLRPMRRVRIGNQNQPKRAGEGVAALDEVGSIAAANQQQGHRAGRLQRLRWRSDALDQVNSASITNVLLAFKRLDLADPA